MSILFFATMTLLLVACGGGGSGTSGIIVPTAPAAPVSINAANAKLISADVLGTLDIVVGFLLVGDVLPAAQVDVAGSEFGYPDFFVQQLRRLPEMDISASDINVVGAVIPPTREPCDNPGGTMTISGDVAVILPEWDPRIGDQITIQFEECELAGIILNGKMAMTITDLAGDFVNEVPPYTLGLDVVLTTLSVEAGGEIAYADGDISMLLDEDALGFETLIFSGNSLTAWGGGEVETLTDYWYYTTLTADLTYTYELEGKLASTVIGGSVSFQMIRPGSIGMPAVPFTGNDGFDPREGELWITTSADASGSRTAAEVDSFTVYIDVYSDVSNDMIIANIRTNWPELEACLLDPDVCS
jgi:hypothetical protein